MPDICRTPPRHFSSLPSAPSTSGSGLRDWDPNAEETNNDIDGDGVPNDLDAVPYDGNLTFPRVAESQYIIIPLTNQGGAMLEGFPVAINNAGHILLAPQAPEGGWKANPGIGDGEHDESRAPRLWKTTGQKPQTVEMPSMEEPGIFSDFIPHWVHSGALDERTLDLDLDPESDRVLAHALWQYPDPPASDPPSADDLAKLPSTTTTQQRIPDLRGRHAFIWTGPHPTPRRPRNGFPGHHPCL